MRSRGGLPHDRRRHQLVSNEFTDLRTISVDASGAQLYLIVGDQLMTAPIVR